MLKKFGASLTPGIPNTGNQYHEWMQGNCIKSCDACREEDDSECRDFRTEAECRDWRDNHGYCTSGLKTCLFIIFIYK